MNGMKKLWWSVLLAVVAGCDTGPVEPMAEPQTDLNFLLDVVHVRHDGGWGSVAGGVLFPYASDNDVVLGRSGILGTSRKGVAAPNGLIRGDEGILGDLAGSAPNGLVWRDERSLGEPLGERGTAPRPRLRATSWVLCGALRAETRAAGAGPAFAACSGALRGPAPLPRPA